MPSKIRVFGPFTLDLSKGELFRNGAKVPMGPNVASLLTLLTDRPGELVTREEMKDVLWKDKGLNVDFDPALNTTMKELRQVLGDSGTSPLYIQRVRTRGYYFIPEVTEPLENPEPDMDRGDREPEPETAVVPELPRTPDSPAVAEAEHGALRPTNPEAVQELTAQHGESPARRMHWQVIAASAAVLLALAVTSYFWFAHRKREMVSILVLPVVNATGDPAKESLADGLTGELIEQLAFMGNKRFVILSRATSMSFKGKNPPLNELRRQFKVGFVLEGEIRDNGTNLTAAMRLERTEDGESVFTRIYPADSNTIRQKVASIMAGGIIAAVQGLPPPLDIPRAYFSPSKDANDDFDEGNRLLAEDKLDRALADFLKVAKLDPNYLDVYTKLAICYYELGAKGGMSQQAAAHEGDRAIDEALFRAPLSSEAHAVRGFSRWFYHWDFPEAAKEFQTAIQRDVGNADAHRWYALSLASAGKGDDAEAEMEKALESNPASRGLLTDKGWIEYLNHRPVHAARTLEGVLRDDPRNEAAGLRLWAVYSIEGRNVEAMGQFCRIAACGAAGQSGKAANSTLGPEEYRAKLIAWSTESARFRDLNVLSRAELAAIGANGALAAQILAAGCRAHDGWLVYLAADPAFDSLRRGGRLASFNGKACGNGFKA